MLKHLDLFSGIGGFALGFRWAGKFETIAFAECDPFCRQVLAKHWPEVKCYDDIRSLRGISVSDVERGRESSSDQATQPGLRPDWLVIENGFHRWRAWVPELRRYLWSLGYASVPLRVLASDLGARHRRARVFVIAHADSIKLRQFTWWWHGPGREVAEKFAGTWDLPSMALGKVDGIPGHVDRRRALGNAIVPQIAEMLGRAILAVEQS